MLRNTIVAILGGVVGLLAACGSESAPSQFGSSSGNDGDGGPSGIFGGGDSGPEPPAVECRKMDIVFVIDNSQSMKEEQENLGKNFPEFVKVINEYKTAKGELLDYRVAITSTDDQGNNKWDQGRFTKSYGPVPGLSCNPGPNNNPWLVREDADIGAYFSCRAQLGTSGANTERPLQAAKLALTDRIQDGTNTMNGESFVREDALLALVIITDEDEGGHDGDPNVPPAPLQSASEYANDYDKVKADLRGRWAAAVIAGDKECPDAKLGKAGEAKRLKQFVSIARNGVFSDICQGDLTNGLKAALDLFTKACRAFPGVK
jgi:hypothetical protein